MSTTDRQEVHSVIAHYPSASTVVISFFNMEEAFQAYYKLKDGLVPGWPKDGVKHISYSVSSSKIGYFN